MAKVLLLDECMEAVLALGPMFLGFGSKGRGKKRQAHQIEGGGAAGASCRRIRGSSSKASEKRRRKAVALAAKKEDALACAAYSGDLAAVKRLLAGGADADKGRNDEVGMCPLASACLGGHTEIARALLKAGAYVNHTPVDVGMIDGAPLNCALGSLLRAEGGSIELVKLLLDAGADVRQRSCPDVFNALSYRSERMEQELVALLEEKAGIDSASDACEWCGTGAKEHDSEDGKATICTCCNELSKHFAYDDMYTYGYDDNKLPEPGCDRCDWYWCTYLPELARHRHKHHGGAGALHVTRAQGGGGKRHKLLEWTPTSVKNNKRGAEQKPKSSSSRHRRAQTAR